jgi:hypothetical protein
MGGGRRETELEWERKDADRYQRTEFQKINEMMQHLIETFPTVKTYNVENSTADEVIARAA